MMIGVPAARPIGVKSRRRIVFQVWKQRRGDTMRAHMAHHDRITVWLGARAAGDAGRAPAPATFSTMTCWPRMRDMGSATMRATISVGPPPQKARSS